MFRGGTVRDFINHIPAGTYVVDVTGIHEDSFVNKRIVVSVYDRARPIITPTHTYTMDAEVNDYININEVVI